MKIDGIEVKDSEEELTVKILPRDVKAGAAKNATACAAAKALCRERKCQAAKVHVSRVYLKEGDAWTRYKTPPSLRNEIIAFDRGGAFEPGEYTLLPVSAGDRAGMRAKRAYSHSPDKTKRPAGKGRKNHVTTGIRKRFEG
jgi:hypothetical protein